MDMMAGDKNISQPEENVSILSEPEIDARMDRRNIKNLIEHGCPVELIRGLLKNHGDFASFEESLRAVCSETSSLGIPFPIYGRVDDALAMSAENNRIWKKYCCKRCQKRLANALFLCCHRLQYCVDCVESSRECPYCPEENPQNFTVVYAGMGGDRNSEQVTE